MKHHTALRTSALIALSLALAACGQQASQPAASDTRVRAQSVQPANLTDETPQYWFVELSEQPTVKGGQRARLEGEKQNFRAQARQRGIQYREEKAFGRLWNGFSVQARPSELAKLKDLPGVRGTYPVVQVTIPEMLHTNEPELATALAMTGADIAQSPDGLGLTGRGVKVAVMDTGIDLEHPDFKDRIVAGYDFVGDAFTGSNEPVPGGRPDDCNGHGTHVAGIVGANGNVSAGGARGVAPEVQLGAYRVFGCDGSTRSDIMIEAMEKAHADGMQVLNMSIGAAFQSWPQYPTAVAGSNLADQGVVVVASIGNSGTGGAFAAGAPGVGEKVIGVASFDNTHVLLNKFKLSTSPEGIGFQQASPSPTAPTEGSLVFAATGTPTKTNDACNVNGASPLAENSLTGKAALIRRGGCTFYEKAMNAQKAGASAVVLYNSVSGRFGASVSGPEAITIPVVAISDTDGASIANALTKGPVELTWTPEQGTFVNPTGNLLSSFSSYGLAADLSLKPDIGAPGGLIRSTWPLTLPGGGYNTISGTSMSSPHVAGLAALLLQAKPGIKPDDVRTLLQNTATPKPFSGMPNGPFIDMVHRQGAGMANIVNAVTTTTMVTPSKLSLGESEGGPRTQTLTVHNRGDNPVTYTLSHAAGLASGGDNPYRPSLFSAPASVTYGADTVTVPARGSAQVTVTISPSAQLADLSQYGGYLVFTPQGAGTTLRVPFAGFKGDYQALKVLTITPFLAKRNADGTFAAQPNGATYTLKDGDVPTFPLHFNHFAQRVRMDVYDARTGKPAHPEFYSMLDERYFGRNNSATGVWAFDWDGTVAHSRGYNGAGNDHDKRRALKNGRYVIKLTVVRALGDENNPQHVETWTSPVITIARP